MAQSDQSNSLPHNTCPVCEKWVAVRKGGQYREHRNPEGDLCPASGMTPRQVADAANAELNAIRRMSR